MPKYVKKVFVEFKNNGIVNFGHQKVAHIEI
jgi:hypothetical protein